MELFAKKNTATSMELVQITSDNKGRQVRQALFELLLTVAMSVGCWYTFFSMFPDPMNHAVSMILIIGLPVAIYGLFKVKFLSRFLVFYVFLLTAIFFVLFYESVWNGLLVMGNIIVEILNDELMAGLITFKMTGSSEQWYGDAMMAMIPVILLVSMGIVHSVYHKEPVLGFVLTGVPVVSGMALKVEPSVWLLLLLIISWAGLMVLSAVARPESKKKNKPIYIQNEKSSSLPYIFLSITLAVLLGYVLLFSGDDYRPAQSVDQVKTSIINTQEHLRYDNLGGSETDGLSRGDLTQTHPIQYTETMVMDLKMQLPQSMYLRSFSGGYFEDDKWTETAEGAYSGEYTGIMEWLTSRDFYPWTQQDQLYRMSDNYDFVEVEVENINTSSKFIYMPYEAAMSDDTLPSRVNYEKDYAAYAKGLRGQRAYTFKAFINRFDDYSEAEVYDWLEEVSDNENWNSYAEAEAVYSRFVYDTYLYMNQEDYDALSGTGISKCSGKTIEYTLHYIRKLFDGKFVYDTEQKAAPAGKSELDYFLNESKTGNDMHFATAAALMFRSAGIPARYAEGYYLSPDDMKLYFEMSDVSVGVLDSQAHAWVEIYVDGIGWFPVEVIPGYYDLVKVKTNETIDDEQIEEDTKKYYQDEVPEFDDLEKADTEENPEANILLIILSIILLLIIIYEVQGRLRLKNRLKKFGAVHTDEQVYAMYRYAGRLMKYDKHKLPENPYDKLDEISAAYDSAVETGFAEYLRMVNQVRFGRISITEEEHKKMAGYTLGIADHIYSKQNIIKKFIMKFILFYV